MAGVITRAVPRGRQEIGACSRRYEDRRKKLGWEGGGPESGKRQPQGPDIAAYLPVTESGTDLPFTS